MTAEEQIPDVAALVAFVSASLVAQADEHKAAKMAAYMKTEQPFYGVQKPQRSQIEKKVLVRFQPKNEEEFAEAVAALWALPHREEQYMAIAMARLYKSSFSTKSLSLFKRIIQEGAWWDFIDEIASKVVAPLYIREPGVMIGELNAWIEDPDLWLRRSAILSQLPLRTATNRELLFDFCLRQAHEQEFFIRKAIGWALRQYSKYNAWAVEEFLEEHQAKFSGLTLREASKHLKKIGRSPV